MKSIGKSDAKYRAILNSCGNIDRKQNPNKPVCDGVAAFAETIEELSGIVRNWIKSNNLGAGNFQMVEVIDNKCGNLVGKISYNGKFWVVGSKYCPAINNKGEIK